MKKGDPNYMDLAAAVGCALTQWEMLESQLAELFDAIVGGEQHAAFAAYSSVVASKSRGEMLRAATKRGLDGHSSLSQIISEFLDRAGRFASRRNEIAHGRIYNLGDLGFCFGPNNINRTKWLEVDNRARYQWVANDITHYVKQFAILDNEAKSLIEKVRGVLTKHQNDSEKYRTLKRIIV